MHSSTRARVRLADLTNRHQVCCAALQLRLELSNALLQNQSMLQQLACSVERVCRAARQPLQLWLAALVSAGCTKVAATHRRRRFAHLGKRGTLAVLLCFHALSSPTAQHAGTSASVSTV
jgi:hypothetical protein